MRAEAVLAAIDEQTAPAIRLNCDICLVSNRREKILRFNLTIMSTREDGRKTTRGAGVMLLCQTCWKRGPGKRRRKWQTR